MAAGSALSLGMLAGCGKKPLKCDDESQLSEPDKSTRHLLKYTDVSADPVKKCSNCVQFQPPPGEGQCGGCKLIKGPINPGGNCTSWVAKPS